MNLFNNDTPEVFSFGIDETAQAHMQETARWAKFLAIVGFVVLGLMIVAGIVLSRIMASNPLLYQSSQALDPSTMGSLLMIVYLFLAALYFYPTFALFQFSRKLRPALKMRDQQQFNESLRYLKNLFRYIGIVVIILISLYALVFVFAFIATAIRG